MISVEWDLDDDFAEKRMRHQEWQREVEYHPELAVTSRGFGSNIN